MGLAEGLLGLKLLRLLGLRLWLLVLRLLLLLLCLDLLRLDWLMNGRCLEVVRLKLGLHRHAHRCGLIVCCSVCWEALSLLNVERGSESLLIPLSQWLSLMRGLGALRRRDNLIEVGRRCLPSDMGWNLL